MWKAHKCVVLIRIGSQQKAKQIDDLIARVRSLELLHKKSLASAHYQAITRLITRLSQDNTMLGLGQTIHIQIH